MYFNLTVKKFLKIKKNAQELYLDARRVKYNTPQATAGHKRQRLAKPEVQPVLLQSPLTSEKCSQGLPAEIRSSR